MIEAINDVVPHHVPWSHRPRCTDAQGQLLPVRLSRQPARHKTRQRGFPSTACFWKSSDFLECSVRVRRGWEVPVFRGIRDSSQPRANIHATKPDSGDFHASLLLELNWFSSMLRTTIQRLGGALFC
ncbi:hypothetical protein J3459_013056 [Metarhizium acridum]|uniref:uncharacterized protein n=1 Tax=Metarhizium acridum TaxID=92637 RepID=UPI001C6A9B22|nr:hypothetical protein J3458_020215 [Metarhizium acridum]KAG8417002.1 hypothetical protein J3459_013056 [Metarhizium acridum]